MKDLALTRVPPGDRWKDPNSDVGDIYESLTEGLQYLFESVNAVEFHISAKDGKVFVVKPDLPKEPEPPKSYSLYGEDY
jgi:hypothetical protein